MGEIAFISPLKNKLGDKAEFWNVLGKSEKLQGQGTKNELGFYFVFCESTF